MIPGWTDRQDLLDDNNILTKPLPNPFEATFVDGADTYIGNVRSPQYIGLNRGIVEFEVTDGFNNRGEYGYTVIQRQIETHAVLMMDYLLLWPGVRYFFERCPVNPDTIELCPNDLVLSNEHDSSTAYINEQ